MVLYVQRNYLNFYNAKWALFIFRIQNTRSNKKRDSYCASFCFYVLYLTKVIGIDLESAVLKLYYQRVS